MASSCCAELHVAELAAGLATLQREADIGQRRSILATLHVRMAEDPQALCSATRVYVCQYVCMGRPCGPGVRV